MAVPKKKKSISWKKFNKKILLINIKFKKIKYKELTYNNFNIVFII